MAFDPLDSILTLLSDNWNTANTDTLTPKFQKVTDQKRMDFRINQDWVLAHRAIEVTDPAGIGPADKNEATNFNLDVRVFGSDQEDHWLNVLGEIKRILKANKLSPFSPTISEAHVLEWDGSGPDLSDKTFHIWRKLIPIQLKRLNVSR